MAKYIYIPYMVRATHFSSVGPVLRNVGGIKVSAISNH